MPSSRRKGFGPHDIGSSAEDASRLIRENMKCPVCLEVLLPPIYQCETGHNICYLCVDEVTECPLCKSDYGDTRNYFAEELVNSMSFPCKYEEYGCHQTFLGSQLKDHQANCACQPYRCPELACQEVVGIHQMGLHLDKHGFKVMSGDIHQASLEILDDHFDRKTEYNPWRISAFDKEFYTVSTRNRDGTWSFWAYGLGSQKEMKKFSYEIVLYSDDKQIMYRGTIQSLRNKPEDIIKNGQCLTTTDHLIKSLRKEGRLKCQVFFIQGKNWEATSKWRATESKKRLKSQKFKNSISSTKQKKTGGSKGIVPGSTTSPPFNGPAPAKKGPRPRSKSQTPSTSQSKSELQSVSTGVTSRTGSAAYDEENSFVRRVRDSLICPSCQEVITPPVFQCTIGHNVCHKCKLSRVDCILCLSPLTDCRNFFAEELLYKTKQKCCHSKHGCKVCLPSAQIKSHEAVCDFAPFECPFNVCRQLICAEDLFMHMLCHQVCAVEKELKSEITVPRVTPEQAIVNIPNIVVIDRIPFYPVIVRENDGNWIIYVISYTYLKYRFEILFKKQSKTLAFQGPVLSLRTKCTDIKLKGSGLMLTEKAIKGLKSSDKLNYQIRIRKYEPSMEMDELDSPLNLPSSWIIIPATDSEVISKTELFANKRTSLSPEEESDYESNTALTAPRPVSEIGDSSSSSDSDEEDTAPETVANISDSSYQGSSKPVPNFHDIESDTDFDFCAGTLPVFDESKSTTLCMRGTHKKSSSQPLTPNRSFTALSSKKKGKQGSLETKKSASKTLEKSAEKLVRNKSPKRKSSLSIPSKENPSEEERPNSAESLERASVFEENDPLKTLDLGSELVDVNNNPICLSKRSSMDSVVSSTVMPVSILKGSVVNLIPKVRPPKPKNISSGNDKPAKISKSDRIVSEATEPAIAKRTRSCSKHRVRLSDEVICVSVNESPEVTDPKVKSEENTKPKSTPAIPHTILRTPSKHVLSVKVHSDTTIESKEDLNQEHDLIEFGGQLKQALSNCTVCSDLMGDVNLLTGTSFNDMKEAVISGSFDVVKSMISLFASETDGIDPDHSSLENIEEIETDTESQI